MTKKILGTIAGLLIVALAVVRLFFTAAPSGTHLKTINIRFPVSTVPPLDPRKIYSIGDQLVAEHIFGFHIQDSIDGGFKPFYSSISIDRRTNKITIVPRFPIRNSDGTAFSLDHVCESLRESFKGTFHQKYGDIFEGATCTEKEVTVSLRRMPANILRLFTLPDLSLYDHSKLPIEQNGPYPATPGPYYISGMQRDEVNLARNHNFPSELVANTVEHVRIKVYKKGSTAATLSEMDPLIDHLIYVVPTEITEEDKVLLEKKGFRLKISPAEALMYVQFGAQVTERDRAVVGRALDEIRSEIVDRSPFMSPAFSLVPEDKPFGLGRSEYEAIVSSLDSNGLSRKLLFGYFKNSGAEVFSKQIRNYLVSKLENIEIREYDISQIEKFDREVDVSLELVGLSPADPISHMFFQRKMNPAFKKLIAESELVTAVTMEDEREFFEAVKELEKRIAKNRVLVPISHLPGIVAVSYLLKEDEKIQWSWGTAAWTYRVQSSR